jgi:antitoxin Phd
MKKSWQLQDAKNRFSEVVDHALRSGPQFVTSRGKDTVVVMSLEHYLQLAGRKDSLVEFLRSSPLRDTKLKVWRDKNLPRKVSL